MSPRRVTVRVPATSANLGSGFDCAGLALALYDEVEMGVASAGIAVEVSGEGAGELPVDATHLVVRCARAAAAALGSSLPGLWLRARNTIPHGRGLGSSAAAVVGGLLAGRALVPDGPERLSDADLLELATRIEGHPDNVAPCLRGGFTLAWGRPVRTVRLSPHADLRPVVFVPPTRLATQVARGLLPTSVPHADAAFNVARSALLVPAMTTDPGLLWAATEDRLHQEYRAPAMPGSLDLVRRLRSAGLAATVSGAGPSVLVLGTAEVAEPAPPGWLRFDVGVATVGASVRSDLEWD